MIKFSNIKLIRSFGIFTISNLINAAIPFLLLPFLTAYLSPKDFGIVSTFLILINVFTPFIGMNSEAVVSRFYFEQEKFELKKVLGNSFYLLSISFFVVSIITFLAGKWILQISFGEGASEISIWWIPLISLIVLAQNINQIQLNLWQVEGQPVKYGIQRIAKTIAEIGISVLLILFVTASWQSRMFGLGIAAFLFAFISVIYLYHSGLLQLKKETSYTRDMLKYGAPLIPHFLSGVIITYSDRLFITNYIGISETGLYSVGYQVGMVISLFQNSFNQAWAPWLFNTLNQNLENDKVKIVKITYLYFIAMLIIVAIFSLFAPRFFDLFLGKEYASGVKFVFWIALGFGFNGMYKMVVNYLFYIKKTSLITMVTVSIAVLNILLNYFLIQSNGAVGSAQATCISFFVEFIIIWILSASFYKMPWLGFKKQS